jgi:hypothetical protein
LLKALQASSELMMPPEVYVARANIAAFLGPSGEDIPSWTGRRLAQSVWHDLDFLTRLRPILVKWGPLQTGRIGDSMPAAAFAARAAGDDLLRAVAAAIVDKNTMAAVPLPLVIMAAKRPTCSTKKTSGDAGDALRMWKYSASDQP